MQSSKRARLECREGNILPDEEPVALYFINFDINFENLHNYNIYLGYH